MRVRPLLRPIIRLHRRRGLRSADLSSLGRASGRATDRPRLGQSRVAFVSMSPPPRSSVGYSHSTARRFLRRSLAAIRNNTSIITTCFYNSDWLSRHLLWCDITILCRLYLRHTIFSIILSRNILFCMPVCSIFQICWRNHRVRRFYRAVFRGQQTK